MRKDFIYQDKGQFKLLQNAERIGDFMTSDYGFVPIERVLPEQKFAHQPIFRRPPEDVEFFYSYAESTSGLRVENKIKKSMVGDKVNLEYRYVGGHPTPPDTVFSNIVKLKNWDEEIPDKGDEGQPCTEEFSPLILKDYIFFVWGNAILFSRLSKDRTYTRKIKIAIPAEDYSGGEGANGKVFPIILYKKEGKYCLLVYEIKMGGVEYFTQAYFATSYLQSERFKVATDNKGDTGMATISVNASAKTFTRTAGSFITDGFKIGDKFAVVGFTNEGNRDARTISGISEDGLTITVVGGTGLVNETGNGDERMRTSAHLHQGSFMLPSKDSAKLHLYTNETPWIPGKEYDTYTDFDIFSPYIQYRNPYADPSVGPDPACGGDSRGIRSDYYPNIVRCGYPATSTQWGNYEYIKFGLIGGAGIFVASDFLAVDGTPRQGYLTGKLLNTIVGDPPLGNYTTAIGPAPIMGVDKNTAITDYSYSETIKLYTASSLEGPWDFDISWNIPVHNTQENYVRYNALIGSPYPNPGTYVYDYATGTWDPPLEPHYTPTGYYTILRKGADVSSSSYSVLVQEFANLILSIPQKQIAFSFIDWFDTLPYTSFYSQESPRFFYDVIRQAYNPPFNLVEWYEPNARIVAQGKDGNVVFSLEEDDPNTEEDESENIYFVKHLGNSRIEKIKVEDYSYQQIVM